VSWALARSIISVKNAICSSSTKPSDGQGRKSRQIDFYSRLPRASNAMQHLPRLKVLQQAAEAE